MKRLTLYILTILTLNFLPIYGQEPKTYFDKVVSIIKFESSSTALSLRLDSLKSKYILSRSNFNNYLDRDLDFGCRHQRLNLEINFERFQIDILKTNDTIIVVSMNTENYKKLVFSQLDTSKVEIFLKKRNKFIDQPKLQKHL